jgi:TolA-binding protein
MTFATSRSALLLVILAVALAACSRNGDKELMAQAKVAGEKNDARAAMGYYEQLLKDYPDSPLAPEALFGIALLQANDAATVKQSAATLESLLAKYPQSPVLHKAVFMLGFLYNNRLNDLPKAKEFYERYLKQYPDSAYAKDAQMELNFLGQSPDSILSKAQQAAQPAQPSQPGAGQ